MNRYQNINLIKYNSTGSQYYVNNLYPDIPATEGDNYVITTLGDRFDILAANFYGDSTLWWVIPAANGIPGDSIFPEPGIQLRIPMNLTPILQSYTSINFVR